LVFLNGLIATPSTPGKGFVLRGFFKMVGAAPQTPRGSSSRLVFGGTARALRRVAVPVVFCGVRAVDGLRFRLFYFLIIFIYINKLLYFFMN
jgi:hypothetical protein